MWILNILCLNLVIVIILETFSGIIFGAKNCRKIITIILANVITNPIVVLCGLSLAIFLPEAETVGMIFLEMGAVATEGYIFHKNSIFENKNPYIISFVLNLLSFTTGEIINLFF